MASGAGAVVESTALTVALAVVARRTQNLKSGREVVLDKPPVNRVAPISNLFAMLLPVAVYVVDDQIISGSTADAQFAIVRKHLLPVRRTLGRLALTVAGAGACAVRFIGRIDKARIFVALQVWLEREGSASGHALLARP